MKKLTDVHDNEDAFVNQHRETVMHNNSLNNICTAGNEMLV